ncbi:MAG: hypothetical protein MR611_05355, partial [Coriobacteriaceae bacterium]|nr:hypothetical protein [Coriobacteriaceae bacterium]
AACFVNNMSANQTFCLINLIKARARGNSRAFAKLPVFVADGLVGAVGGGRGGRLARGAVGAWPVTHSGPIV